MIIVIIMTILWNIDIGSNYNFIDDNKTDDKMITMITEKRLYKGKRYDKVFLSREIMKVSNNGLSHTKGAFMLNF